MNFKRKNTMMRATTTFVPKITKKRKCIIYPEDKPKVWWDLFMTL